MELSEKDLPKTWSLRKITDEYRFTRKPRGLSSNGNGNAFIPMDMIPIGSMYVSHYEVRERVGSGTYFENGDFLLAKITPSFENGKQAIAAIDRPHAYATTEVIPIQEVEEKSDKRFLYYYLLHPEVRNDLAGRMEGSTGRQRLNKTVVGNHQMPFPPYAEQQKIAYVLSVVQRAMEQQERLIQTTTELKKALMQKLFTEGTRGEPQKQSEIGPVPQSWDVKSIGEVASLLSGGTPSKKRREFWDGDIPWVSPKDMKKPRLSKSIDHITEEGLDSGSRLAPKGSLLIVIRGMILAKAVPVALAECPLAFNQDMKAIVPNNADNAEFILYALQAAQRRLFLMVGSSAHGTRTLLTSAIEGCLIPFPESKERAKIVNAMKTLETKRRLHREKRASLGELFKTLLHKLMTAEIRVHDIDLPGFKEWLEHQMIKGNTNASE